MTSTLAESGNGLGARLRALRANQPALSAVALATRAGLPLASDAGDGIDADTLAALGVDLLTSAEAPARALAGGEPREATVRGPSAQIIALAAGESAVLVAITDALTPTSSIMPDLRAAAGEIAEGL
ncbi:MAG: roadblock/LC7 domain-containing protein [Armatimonadota bacterium]|jgi:predicted regulator of Ras-like GTPase activity (Roadblock/LC7/MglB family)